MSTRARSLARDACVVEFGFDPRLSRHPDAPQTRGECQGHEGKCPWASCRHHLALDLRPASISVKSRPTPRSIRLVFRSDDLDGWPEECCSLDVVDSFGYPEGGRGVMTFSEIGERMSLTKERARQIYSTAALKFLKGMTAEGVDPLLTLEWLEGSTRKPPEKPSPLRRAQVLGKAAASAVASAAAAAKTDAPRLSPRDAALRRQELLRTARTQRLREVAEARERAKRSDRERAARALQEARERAGETNQESLFCSPGNHESHALPPARVEPVKFF